MFNGIGIFVCDMQTSILPHIRNSSRLIRNTRTILRANNEYKKIVPFDKKYGPVVVAEFLNKKLGHTEPLIINALPKFNTTIFNKKNYSMFNKDMDTYLRNNNINKILLTGVQTEWCITQTALDLKENGYDVDVIQDATGSQSDYEHLEALERLRRRGIWTNTTHGWLVEKLRIAEHPVTKWYLKELKNKDL